MGKHLQLFVPNYSGAGTPNSSPLSYIRLGQAFGSDVHDPIASADRGDELVSSTTFQDDARQLASKTKSGKKYYRDHGVGEPVTRTPKQLTDELMTRGGVREHTDGNYISTTRGDYVEVVGGNYKMIVLGRVTSSTTEPTYFESSGGHNWLQTSHTGYVTSIDWEKGASGTWLVKEKTLTGNKVSKFEGHQEDVFFGPTLRTEIGTDPPSPGKHFGDAVPTIEELTYAQKIGSYTKATNQTSTTTVTSKSEEYRIAPIVNDFTGACPLGEVAQFKSRLYANTIDVKHGFGNRYFHSVGLFSFSFSCGAETHNYSKPKFVVDLTYNSFDLSVAAEYTGIGFGTATSVAVGFGSKECSLALDVKITLGVSLQAIGNYITGKIGDWIWSGLELDIAISDEELHAALFEGVGP